MIDILVAGEINPDLVLSGVDVEPRFDQVEALVESAELTIGSSSAIFACGATRLGLKVAFIGIVGDDLFGRFMSQALAQRGVDISPIVIDPYQRTGISVILNRGSDRAILTYPGAIASLRAEQVSDDLLRGARHLHIASYFLQTALQPNLPELLERAHAFGLTTSLDPNWDPHERWQGFDQLLPRVDVLLPNQAEAISLSGGGDLDQAVLRLSQKCPVVAVKLGPDGALARQGLDAVRAPAIPLQVVDTVGAGDSFDTGFLYGYLAGWKLERALRLGVACGSLSTRDVGGVSAQPTLEEALAHC
jgi:sugar/nucleoside kinase (ribokinase family)